MKKTNLKELKKLAAEAKLAMSALESAKLAYKKMDEITEQIIKANVDLSEFGIVVVDNFSDKNKVWKSSAVSRFELKLVKAG